MKGHYAEIKSDVFDISKRIKEIDKGYYIVFNRQKQRFEVHHKLQRGGSYCFAVPYKQLDARTLTLTRKTMAKNAKKVFDEIENDNKRLQKEQIEKAVKIAEKNMEEQLRHDNKRLHS